MQTDGATDRANRGDVATITPCRDGPLLVRGPFRLTDQEGNEIDARRCTIALCRCGRSAIPPFCDGTHKVVRFKAPTAAQRPGGLPSGGNGGRRSG
jgi:CDGSH-type Zn-finger protein